MQDPLSTSLPLKLLQVVVGLFMGLTILFTVILGIRYFDGDPLELNGFGQTFSHPPVWMMLMFFLFTLIVLWIIGHLYRVITRTRNGEIFSMHNVKDLRLLGYASLAWWTSPLWLKPLLTGDFALKFGLSSHGLLTSPFTIALIFFVFAEVLREGIRLRENEQHLRKTERQLREEQELTI